MDHPSVAAAQLSAAQGVAAVEGGEAIQCPWCAMISCHPKDVQEGYCGNCHDWTGGRVMSLEEAREIKRQRAALSTRDLVVLDALLRQLLERHPEDHQ